MYWGGMTGHMGWGMNMIEEEGWRKGPWTAEEDRLLIEYVRLHGEGRWNSVSRLAGTNLNSFLLLLYTLQFDDPIDKELAHNLRGRELCFRN